jgi:methionine-rich copper-binding protein CopC
VTATDTGDISGGVHYSLKAGGDAADFSIDSATGAVTLTGNPDYETQSSYAFTVVATDAAGHATEQAVTLPIGNVGPTVVSETITSASGALHNTLNAGDTVTVQVTMNEATTVDTTHGVPTLDLNVGGSTVHAQYLGGSGTTTLSFQYTVQAGDNDANGISIDANALHANGGTLRDAGGADATLTHAAVSDNAAYMVDTTAPTLSSSSPADHGQQVALGSNIELTFSEDVFAGSGNIVISSGTGDTRTISITDTSQVTISGTHVTINPTADLLPTTTYTVQVDAGALKDAAGNTHAGIGAGALDFTSGPRTDVVVFDLVNGVDSSHSDRTFDANVSYTIYIRVDNSYTLSQDGTGPVAGSSWGEWKGGENLGADDRIVLVGSGTALNGLNGNVAVHTATGNYIAWGPSVVTLGVTGNNATMWRYVRGGTGAGTNVAAQLWTGHWAANPNANDNLGNAYLLTMPANVLHTQGLA